MAQNETQSLQDLMWEAVCNCKRESMSHKDYDNLIKELEKEWITTVDDLWLVSSDMNLWTNLFLPARLKVCSFDI